jgi:hypothetical protein
MSFSTYILLYISENVNCFSSISRTTTGHSPCGESAEDANITQPIDRHLVVVAAAYNGVGSCSPFLRVVTDARPPSKPGLPDDAAYAEAVNSHSGDSGILRASVDVVAHSHELVVTACEVRFRTISVAVLD